MRPLLLAFGVLACSSTSPPPPGAPGPTTPPPREPAVPSTPLAPANPPTEPPPAARGSTAYACEKDADCVVSSATGTCSPCGGCPHILNTDEATRRAAAEAQCPKRRPDPNTHCSDCPPGPAAAACIDHRCAPAP